MFVEYKAYEPNFYSMSVGDWGQSLLYAQKLGPKAFTLVDLGHHLPNANIEQIVALLLNEGTKFLLSSCCCLWYPGGM